MNAPQRHVAPAAAVYVDNVGDLVLFAAVEPALRDADRLAWMLPIISGNYDDVAITRGNALAAGVLRGLSGGELVDFARERCPA